MDSAPCFLAAAAIDAKPPFCYHSKRSRGRNPLNPRDAPWIAGGEFRISCLIDKTGLTDFDNDKSGLTKIDNQWRSGASERRSRIELLEKLVISNNKAGYGGASTCNHVAHSLFVFCCGLYQCPSYGVDSRVRHVYFLREHLREDHPRHIPT